MRTVDVLLLVFRQSFPKKTRTWIIQYQPADPKMISDVVVLNSFSKDQLLDDFKIQFPGCKIESTVMLIETYTDQHINSLVRPDREPEKAMSVYNESKSSWGWDFD